MIYLYHHYQCMGCDFWRIHPAGSHRHTNWYDPMVDRDV